MVAQITTVAFEGIRARRVDVQVQITSGLPAFTIVGLPDKAVAESRERVRGALAAMGLALPPKRITVSLSPADLPKEGSHFDLPIALGLLGALEVVEQQDLAQYLVLGELGLDAGVRPVPGVLPAAVHAMSLELGLICPAEQGPEAAWAGDITILAPTSLLALLNHFRGDQLLTQPEPGAVTQAEAIADLADIKGQETAKRALEIAACGGHNLLMIGPPGSGKSMLAARLAGLLPPLAASEALEVSMIQSVAGLLHSGRITRTRPFRNPHHNASMPALVGGGNRVRPGEVSLAHRGVLFLDELPEFSRQALEALRQPLESGEAMIARASSHVRFPARVQLVAAMNPCRCGYLDDPARACSRAPRCALDYQSRISGPLIDRIDLTTDVPAVSARELTAPATGETSQAIRERVIAARAIQKERLDHYGGPAQLHTNADVDGELLHKIADPDGPAKNLLEEASDRFGLTARGFHRVLRVARTLADMENVDRVGRHHIAEALSFRRIDYV